MTAEDRTEAAAEGRFQLGDWRVDPSLNRLSRGAERVQLEPRAMDLLVFLARHPGEVLAREKLIDGVWAAQFVGEGVLRQTIAILRDALGDDARNPAYIETISKRGYRLIADVERGEEPGEAEGPAAGPTPLYLRPAVWLVLLGIVGALVVYVLVSQRPASVPAVARIADSPPRILVLPFANLGPSEHEYLADGMTDEIIGRLGAMSELQVISRTTAMRYKDTDKSIGDIGEELEVDFVLEGTVRWDRSENDRGRVRITPQLIRVRDDSRLWGEPYDRVIEDILAVQSDIAQRVTSNLEIHLLEHERRAIEAVPTDNADAYHAYLRGLRYADKPNHPDIAKALDLFERAVELDPDFALAHARLSVTHMLAFFTYYDPTPERAELARRAADRALELEPGLPEGHWALGQYFDGCLYDYERAMEHYRVAARLRPNDPDILFGMGLARGRQQGGWLESVSLFERAVAIDPQNPRNLIMLAGTLSGGRRHEEAAAMIERAIAVAPDDPLAYQIRHTIYWSWYGPSPQSRRVLEDTPSSIAGMEFPWFMQEFHERNFEAALELVARHPEPWIGPFPKPLAECFCWYPLQRPERVRSSCEAARAGLEQALVELPESHGYAISLGLAHAVLGNRQQAVDYGERAIAGFPSPYAAGARETALGLAMIYLLAGEHDRAIDQIESLLAIPGQLSVAVLQNEVGWEPLYEHPRFQELLETYAEP